MTSCMVIPHSCSKPASQIFTPRELQLIRLLIEQGLSTSEAAWELRISRKTGAVHRAHIMEKVRTALRLPECRPIGPIDLALFAMANHLVDCATIEKKYS